MTAVVDKITVDCADPWQLAQFWAAVTGHPVTDEDEPGDDEVGIVLESGIMLLFVAVPEPKAGKNRLHVCLRPDIPRDEEVQRLLTLGATLYDDHRSPDGPGWAVLRDPEGNEFCVERSAAEKKATENKTAEKSASEEKATEKSAAEA
ncbi:VOC family protein [Amycolatopsis jiangsuensis]|uniref:Putative enzyme related to lactoylglutathione lyase n=1 Tax=Amycolatopsis jiangsuensis TaxID=1181879 RepID=A0A840IVL8_9PSEU|nr:VOC family protein [Amycolatopsis jiangsuensis]MBB4685475.1 putative enzyme related to lactoylglutathione lyase [Amycolatopsis jiangsuensis]